MNSLLKAVSVISTVEEAKQWSIPNIWEAPSCTSIRSIQIKNLVIGFIYYETNILLSPHIKHLEQQPDTFTWIISSDIPWWFIESWNKLAKLPTASSRTVKTFSNYTLNDNRILLWAITNGWLKAIRRQATRSTSFEFNNQKQSTKKLLKQNVQEIEHKAEKEQGIEIMDQEEDGPDYWSSFLYDIRSTTEANISTSIKQKLPAPFMGTQVDDSIMGPFLSDNSMSPYKKAILEKSFIQV
ncbi:hypothetical protein L873DRAFT_914291 [Choiromyces venosus 120613-1]|uniref:Uncharacterized protein n=1 Tax=Choiromyces venosus 120613-1 TaxID=1336337 RepID=A0A3N4ITG4_9PEZI|nr:hypothetical protein L873DRAFT_914291 [Choiromyces venosus 120613-1]